MYSIEKKSPEAREAGIADVSTISNKTELLRQIVQQKVTEDKAEAEIISANFQTMDRRLSAVERNAVRVSNPTNWGHIRALGLRYGFLASLLVMTISGSLVGYTSQFENAELNHAAWAGIWFPGATALTLLVPAWFTRRK